MPTPVNIARQCLAIEAAQVLDDAVAVAHRRCHAQTSSLHAISALLSLPSSPLREACGRPRNSACTSRIQFKALELCLGVSLDRLPSTPQREDEPPVSNSLMAAIKRSQANQRRQPENFHLYQQTASSSPSSVSVSMVKVELQNFILSILDDPVVSRLFGESGFRSSDIKLSILRPVHRHLLRGKGQPIFLCNFTNNFSFPFHGCFENSEIFKRITEILVGKHGKKRSNPLLVGKSAIDAVNLFLETLQKKKSGGFPQLELSGLSIICIKNEISDYVTGNSDVGLFKSRLEEVGCVLKQGIGPVVVEFGELKPLISDNTADAGGFVVRKLGGLVADHGCRVWLIGAAESHEACSQFFKNFPCVEQDWDLHLVPIRPRIAETFPKSSLMESFVPFGGFFSMPSDIKSISNHFGSLCHICETKFNQEASPVSSAAQAQDVLVLAADKLAGLQKKWHSICQRLHQRKTTYTQIPSIMDFHVLDNRSSPQSPCHTRLVCSLSGSNDTASGDSVTTDLGLGVSRWSSQFLVDQKDYKLMYSSLLRRVGRQEEALDVISRAVASCRAQKPNRGGIWFGFMGPDRAGKRKTAGALAEVLFGDRENTICVDLSSRDLIDGCDLNSRGKNIVDFVADEISKKPLSVVFLANVEMADMMTQHFLTRAVSSGRFSNSHGRDVNVSNAVFVLALGPVLGGEVECVEYTEENVLKAKGGPIRMLTGFDLADVEKSPSRKRVRVTHSGGADSAVLKNKRKQKGQRTCLDLNQPADYENGKVWLEKLLEEVDEKVSFKAFDLDGLAERILKEIGDCFEKAVGVECLLEMDMKVMEGILKAWWFSEGGETKDWIEGVLGEAFAMAKKKYDLCLKSVVKLVAGEEKSAGVLLPDRIIMK